MPQQITVPDLGDFKDVEVIDVLVKPGDEIALETPLLTLETEKATMDVPSSAAGVVKEVALKKGDRVSKGSLILTLDAQSASRAADSQKAEPQPVAAPTTPSPQPSAAQDVRMPRAQGSAGAAPRERVCPNHLLPRKGVLNANRHPLLPTTSRWSCLAPDRADTPLHSERPIWV